MNKSKVFWNSIKILILVLSITAMIGFAYNGFIAGFLISIMSFVGWCMYVGENHDYEMFVENQKEKLSPSEALYGLMAWVTTREKEVTFSAKNECSIAAKLVDDFCKAHDLERPEEQWCEKLRFDRLNESCQTINYERDIDGNYKTDCIMMKATSLTNLFRKVGSYSCDTCEYQKSNDRINKIVYCKKEDKFLKMF